MTFPGQETESPHAAGAAKINEKKKKLKWLFSSCRRSQTLCEAEFDFLSGSYSPRAVQMNI